MKKILSVLAALILVICSGCGKKVTEKPKEKEEQGAVNGVWISFIELDQMVNSGDFDKTFSTVVKNCKDFNITDIFLHAVPFCDAIYKSKIYCSRYENAGIDVLETAIKLCHKNGIRVHAWMNPYRVKQGDNDPSTLNKNSLAYKWLNDDDPANDKNVLFTDTGIYLNPAEIEVRQTIISAVREIVACYKIDGVHFDDYFYPTTDESFDKVSYSEYAADTNNPLSLGDFRRANVNALISGCYTAIKFKDKKVLFSISPAADIEKNYEAYYADIDAWCKNECVDIIIPQLYFGYEYKSERFCFDNLLPAWKRLLEGTNTRLCIGLGVYKTGTATEADGEEWQNNDDILSRETLTCAEDADIDGQIFYSYSSLFSDEELNTRVRNNIKKVLNNAEK